MSWNDCPICKRSLTYIEDLQMFRCDNEEIKIKGVYFIHYEVRFPSLEMCTREIQEIYRFDKYTIIRSKLRAEIYKCFIYDEYDFEWINILTINYVIPFNKFYPVNNLLKILNFS